MPSSNQLKLIASLSLLKAGRPKAISGFMKTMIYFDDLDDDDLLLMSTYLSELITKVLT